MANKHKNRINKETGDRQTRRSKSDYSMLNETALILFEVSSFTVKDIGKERLSTHKPVSLSAIDKNRLETQKSIGKALVYIIGKYCYIESSIDGSIKRLCIVIIHDDKTASYTRSYELNDIACKMAVLKTKDFLARLIRYLASYGYKLDIEIV